VVVALLAAMMLAIVAALALVGPGLATGVSHSVYCMKHAQEAICS
jgi:hypothetical protein